MTRINADINPSELKRAHLIAEWREITMVPAALRRSLNSKSINSVLRSIPSGFTLNTGHVTFFYDKQQFLRDRFDKIAAEMVSRGMVPDISRKDAFDGLPKDFYGNWKATESDNNVVRERIALRISQKPHLYKD
jgi:deoxyribonuclease (pyrimidine dimer)